jgi:hypothetical protein
MKSGVEITVEMVICDAEGANPEQVCLVGCLAICTAHREALHLLKQLLY